MAIARLLAVAMVADRAATTWLTSSDVIAPDSGSVNEDRAIRALTGNASGAGAPRCAE